MKVKFSPQNVEFEIKPNESVMHVAQDNGIYIKSVCKGVPSCAECRVRVVEGEHNVLPPGSEELSLIGTGHFIDRRRLSCQLKCFGDITVDMTEQIGKENGTIVGRKKKSAIKDDRVEQAVVIRADDAPRGDADAGDVVEGGDVASPDQAARGPRGDRPQGDRPRNDRGPRNDRPRGDRGPRPERPQGDRPSGAQGDRPQVDRPRNDRGPRAERPNDGRPQGGQGPRAERPNDGRPQGDRPPRPQTLGPDGQPIEGQPREGGGKRRRRRRGGKGGGGGGQGPGGGGPSRPSSGPAS